MIQTCHLRSSRTATHWLAILPSRQIPLFFHECFLLKSKKKNILHFIPKLILKICKYLPHFSPYSFISSRICFHQPLHHLLYSSSSPSSPSPSLLSSPTSLNLSLFHSPLPSLFLLFHIHSTLLSSNHIYTMALPPTHSKAHILLYHSISFSLFFPLILNVSKESTCQVYFLHQILVQSCTIQLHSRYL